MMKKDEYLPTTIAFVCAVLYQFSKKMEENKRISDAGFEFLREVVQFANEVSAEVCTKMGCLTAISTKE